MKIVTIEGNIGSGKSTFVQTLKDELQHDRVCFLQEPVEIWESVKDISGVSILENFYKDSKKYAFSFQMMAYISRLSIIKRAIESNKYDVIVTERCLLTDKNIFCKMLYDDEKIEEIEYTIYTKWFDEFDIHSKIETIHVYLKCDTNTAYERVCIRNRPGENIDRGYLERCNQYHDLWVDKIPPDSLIVLNANLKKEDSYKEWVKQVSVLW